MEIKRSFLPGDHWLYLKIYTGIKTADSILQYVIEPLTQSLLEDQKISHWFFIRYKDEFSHLRLRIYVSDHTCSDEVLHALMSGMKDYVSSGEISNILSDTYTREIERYGESAVSHAEVLFYHNSILTLPFLWIDDEEKLMCIMFYIDQILSEINLPIAQKLEWIKNTNYLFKEEFNADKKLNQQLDKKYRIFYPKFSDFLQSEDFSEFREMVTANIALSKDTLEELLLLSENDPSITLQYFFQSIFHMAVNRLFISEQRLFEMITYDYLYRYYKTLLFRNNNQISTV
ncbi:MAG: thiopeptide-type bacteriocin biosynthesis protein [Chryseobacterium sp.]|nr:thiopeptide-type bacteriocin biosynthesis protein [Chryseobacterium sp.]